MIRLFKYIIISCLLMSCQSIKLEKQATRNITGTYICKYPVEYTTTINEDNKIIIKKNSNKFEGLYFGTTDEFDKAREGYLPGYFVDKIPSDHDVIVRLTEQEYYEYIPKSSEIQKTMLNLLVNEIKILKQRYE